MPLQQGCFTVSLDFELYWGLRDIFPLSECTERLQGARKAIPEILRLFQEYDVHATWATVGFLFYPDKSALLKDIPVDLPAYKNSALNPYSAIDEIGDSEQSDPYHYAPSLIEKIQNVPGQEIASHTFSHYYCLEKGQSKECFRCDLQAAKRAAQSMEIDLKSLVFPRNQCNEEYLEVCRELGFTAWRGNPRSWMYAATDDDHQSIVHRIARLTDAYINLSGRHCHDPTEASSDWPREIPASRFLRPYSKKLSTLEPLRLKRIKDEMSDAAKRNRLYHLWWHPHNFGTDTEENLRTLETILAHYLSLSDQYGMCSLSMAELAEQIHGSPT